MHPLQPSATHCNPLEPFELPCAVGLPLLDSDRQGRSVAEILPAGLHHSLRALPRPLLG